MFGTAARCGAGFARLAAIVLLPITAFAAPPDARAAESVPSPAPAFAGKAEPRGAGAVDLVARARFNRSPVAPGATLRFLAAFTNEGSASAPGASIRFQLPPGLTLSTAFGTGPGADLPVCSGSTLVVCAWSVPTDPGVLRRVELNLILDADASPDAEFEIQTTVESAAPDANIADNTVSSRLRALGAQSNLGLAASLPDGVVAGAPFVVRLDVSNAGPDPAPATSGALQLPPGTSFVSGECDASQVASIIEWNPGAIEVGATRRCDLVLTLDTAACAVTDIAVGAEGVNDDPVPGDNVALLGNATGNLVLDPSFELLDNTTWQEQSIVFPGDIVCSPVCGTGGGTVGPRTGTAFVWFGGTSNPETASVTQSVVIPPTARTLTFWNQLGVCGVGGELDSLRFLIDGVERWRESSASPRCAGVPYFEPVVVPLADFANGASHELRFQFSKSALFITNFALDDVSIGSAPVCALPPQIFDDGFED
jgi:hypothetical protein